MVDKEKLMALFMELVQIDSLSRQERLMADRLKDELDSLGGQVREDRTGQIIKGTAGNLIADFPGNKDYPVILLSAHMDRVKPGLGIRPVVRDGYVVSEGETVLAGDDIIGVTAILEALHLIRENGLEHGPLRVVFSVAEEVGLLGAKNLDQSVIEADYGLVFDVDGDIGTVVSRAPSQIKFNAVIHGRAAHAGINPETGVNAIKIASKAISDLQLGRIDEQTTANIGVIRGGRAANIVPDLVELEGEVRSHNDVKLQRQQQHMEEVIRQAADKYLGEVEIEIERLYSGFALPEESDIIRLVGGVIEKLGLPLKLTASGGGSDANIFNQRGLPTVNLGTGMEDVHSTAERVKIVNMVKLVELVVELIS